MGAGSYAPACRELVMKRTYRRWTPQEETSLLFLVGAKPLASVARELNRTPRSISSKLSLMGRNVKDMTRSYAGLSMEDVVRALGLQHRQRVRNWIERGWLKAQKRKVLRRAYVTIPTENLERFMASWGALMSDLHPNEEWSDFIHDCRRTLLGRLVVRRDVAEWLHVKDWHIVRLILLGFPPPEFTVVGLSEVYTAYPGDWKPHIGAGGYFDRAAIWAWLQTERGHPYLTDDARKHLAPSD